MQHQGALRTTVISIILLVAMAGSRPLSPVSGNVSAQEGAALLAVTPLLPYQGRLTNPVTGQPVPDGDYAMTFTLYDGANVALWSETKDVVVARGIFSTSLGSVAPLEREIFQGQGLWLGIRVQSDPEMTPRQQVLPAPYALSLLPGARIESESADPALTVNNIGAGSALRVEGLTTVTGNAEVEGDAFIQGDTHISGGLWTRGMTMSPIYLPASGTICATRGGTNVLSWDKANNDLELSNSSGDWLDYWYIKATLGGLSGQGNALATGSSNAVIVDLAANNDEGAEIHFGQADGSGGWCSAWVQYANGVLVGHTLCY